MLDRDDKNTRCLPRATTISFLIRVAARYNPSPGAIDHQGFKSLSAMNSKKRQHYKNILLAELRRHAQQINDEQASALEITNDDVKDSDHALHDVIQGLALKLSDNESKMVADIDQALMRMEEGSFGMCLRCGREIDEVRLEAVPTARYDAACQTLVEAAKGQTAGPSL